MKIFDKVFEDTIDIFKNRRTICEETIPFLLKRKKVMLSIAFGIFMELSSSHVFAQQVTLNMKNASLETVLTEVRKQTGFAFASDAEFANNSTPVTIKVDHKPLQEALNLVFKDQPLQYSIKNKIIVIEAPSSSDKGRRSTPSSSQQEISGRVVDSKGIGMYGVTIREKGTNRGVSTAKDGSFNFSNLVGNAILSFQHLGYHTIEQAASQGMVVTMQQDPANLDEVVVVGYGTQQKGNITGAVSTINAKALESRPIVNLGQGLQGLVPNLNIGVGNGKPGTGASFNIRGTTSLSGGGPLILVDGVVMDPNQISPADVESVTVLKDAASASIYGARAAYGAILITTKKGKSGKPQVSVNSSLVYNKPTRVVKYLNSVEFIKMHMLANENGKRDGGTTATSISTFTEDDLKLAQAYMDDPQNNPYLYVDPGNPTRYRYVANTDWVEELYSSYQPMTDNNVSISGGGEKSTFLGSFNHLGQKGLLRVYDEKYNRYNASFKMNSEITPWLSVNGKVTANMMSRDLPNREFDGGGVGDANFISNYARPTVPVYNPDGRFAGVDIWTNQIAIIKQSGNYTERSTDLWLTGGIVLNPFKNFKVVSDYTFNNYGLNSKRAIKEFQRYGVDGVPLGIYSYTQPSRVTEGSGNDQYKAFNIYAEYENTFDSKHYLKGTLGYNQELKQMSSFSATARFLIDQNFPAINLNADPRPGVGGGGAEWAIQSVFGRLNYIYDNRYLVELITRNDGSSRFPRDNRYVLSPTVSAGWRLSNEPFFKFLNSSVNNLMLRASWGKLGNQTIDSYYPYIATLPTNTQLGYIFDNQLSIATGVPGLVSSSFTWEKAISTNVGIDFSLLENRLSGSFDYFIRDTKDMIVGSFPLPSVLGTSPPSRNAADLRNKGWEFTLGWRNTTAGGLTYNIDFNLSDYQAEITKYDLNTSGLITDRYVGQKLGEIWGYESSGLFQSDAEAAQQDQQLLAGSRILRAGDVNFVDLNGNGKIDFGNNTLADPGDRRIIGNSTPRYSFGLRTGLQYKNFDLDIFFQGVLKRDAMLWGSFFWGFEGEWDVPSKASLDYWTPENTDAYFPTPRFGGGGNYQTSTRYLQNAAYARLKNLSLGYTFNPNLLKRLAMDRLRVYVSGQNVFEITSLNPNFDPEMLTGNIYPLSRGFSVGAQLRF
ncbi:TonB-dependent receptor [Sphingobacterium spiritivorum]|uniref:TonB-dependent receptor n=1 Tax=Sphingobacterium spiritivorum TaxID=258 RepID=UPI003DA1F51F